MPLILFDFDYTLADSSAAIIHCFQEAYREAGEILPEPDSIRKAIGMPLQDMIRSFSPSLNKQQVENLTAAYIRYADLHATNMTQFYDSVLDMVQCLTRKGYSLGIVSTKYRYRIQEALEKNDFAKFFSIIVGGEDVSEHKPSPEGIFKAIDAMNETIENTCYIGDSLYDYHAAQNAGVRFWGTMTGATEKNAFTASGCDEAWLMEDLSVLPDRLDQWHK